MKCDDAVTNEEVDQAIKAVRAGDPDAFASVIRAYHVPVRALIGARIYDKSDADDLAQQTFVYAYQNLEKYQIGTNCLAWLKAIARNKIMAHFKRYSQSQKNLQNFRKQQILQRSSELAGAEVDVRLEALGSCVKKLPGEKREFLRQVNHRDSTLAELAEALGRSGPALRKQVSRLYGALRDCIEKKLKSDEV